MAQADKQAQDSILLATFLVRGTSCALDASGVQEVMRLARLTTVHHAAPEVMGVINMRGRIVTILDVGLRMGFDRAVLGPDSRVFIIEDRSEFIGLLVDRVGEVVEVQRNSIEPTPANVQSGRMGFFHGVVRTGGRITTLINIEQVLSDAVQ